MSRKKKNIVLPDNSGESTQQVIENKEKIASLLRATGALFDTLDLDIYKKRLDSFTYNELTNEAFRVGLKGGQERTHMTRAIIDIFNNYRAQFIPNVAGYVAPDNLTDAKRQRALELMRDGR